MKGNIIEEDDLRQEIQDFLIDEQWQTDAAEAKKAARRMIRQLHERNYILCLRGPQLYGFVHRTFLEFLTAAEYVRRFDRQPQQMTIEELIELFDEHCRDDDWREVLRLICGQIDELFVGRIVEHLVTRMNLQKWNGETPLPELQLAIYALSEVRNKKKLEGIGEILLKAAIKVYRVGRGEHIVPLLDAAKALGTQWPSGHKVATIAIDMIKDLPHGGRLYWPQFVAALHPDKAVILEFLDSELDEVRWDAIEALASHWSDETTRKRLTVHAVQDQSRYARAAALRALVKKWPDKTTRELLSERAVAHEHDTVRTTALEALVETWLDESTRKMLAERVRVDGVSASVFGGQHSDFGRIVFRRSAEFIGSALDPHEPITRKHIELAAKAAGVPADKINETVRSLSAHMGWDITKGSGK